MRAVSVQSPRINFILNGTKGKKIKINQNIQMTGWVEDAYSKERRQRGRKKKKQTNDQMWKMFNCCWWWWLELFWAFIILSLDQNW